ncbi:flagellar basal body rod protein FlgC [Oscillospiraceae bacterium LTW-04]|nr:flagellar basal body rod protein FlgC [Oscillospiraceae bacterium MB24-C1]
MSSFLNSLNITGSALTAERFRMDIISQNLANIDTTKTEDGTPYRRKQVVFEERPMDFKAALKDERRRLGGGVKVAEVVESQEDFIPVYDPEHPHADENGYVMKPNVNRAEETVDLMAASTAYNANITALNIVKQMTVKALELGK